MKQRIITAVFFVAIFLGLLLYESWTAQMLFIMVLFFMIYEYFATVFAGDEGAFGKLFSGIILSAAIIILGVYKYDLGDYADWIFGLMIVYTIAGMLYFLLTKKAVLSLRPYYIQSKLYLTLPIAYLLFQIREDDHFRMVILAVILMIWVSDTAAYLVGSQFGKNKIAPTVSPGKTWEGFFGSALGLTILVFAIKQVGFVDYSIKNLFMIAGVVWIFGTMGDFIESSFKRHFQIKDSSNILPGHGGFLDRFDSFIFAIPLVLLLIKYCF